MYHSTYETISLCVFVLVYLNSLMVCRKQHTNRKPRNVYKGAAMLNVSADYEIACSDL